MTEVVPVGPLLSVCGPSGPGPGPDPGPGPGPVLGQDLGLLSCLFSFHLNPLNPYSPGSPKV